MDENTKLLGHRGAQNIFLENTLESFREAILLLAHGIELDVRMTKDCILIIHHDETLDRLSLKDKYYCENLLNRKIKDLTWKEIEQATLIDSQNRKYSILKLEDFLNSKFLINSQTLINLEIKERYCSIILSKLLTKLFNNKIYSESRFLISSFYIEPIRYFSIFKSLISHKNRPKPRNFEKEDKRSKSNLLRIGLIVDQYTLNQKGYTLLNYLEENLKGPQSEQIDTIILGKELLNNDLSIFKNYKIATFTVNSLDDLKCCKLKLDIIISDI